MLHPFGHIVVAAVLPGGEPEEDEPCIVGSGLLEQGIDKREIELVLLRLDLLPIDGYFQGIGMEVIYGLPEVWEHGRPGA